MFHIKNNNSHDQDDIGVNFHVDRYYAAHIEGVQQTQSVPSSPARPFRTAVHSVSPSTSPLSVGSCESGSWWGYHGGLAAVYTSSNKMAFRNLNNKTTEKSLFSSSAPAGLTKQNCDSASDGKPLLHVMNMFPLVLYPKHTKGVFDDSTGRYASISLLPQPGVRAVDVTAPSFRSAFDARKPPEHCFQIVCLDSCASMGCLPYDSSGSSTNHEQDDRHPNRKKTFFFCSTKQEKETWLFAINNPVDAAVRSARHRYEQSRTTCRSLTASTVLPSYGIDTAVVDDPKTGDSFDFYQEYYQNIFFDHDPYFCGDSLNYEVPTPLSCPPATHMGVTRPAGMTRLGMQRAVAQQNFRDSTLGLRRPSGAHNNMSFMEGNPCHTSNNNDSFLAYSHSNHQLNLVGNTTVVL